ncbi:MAG: hypothetical protein ACI9U2_004214 [Bradymonadia bacterium]|jgi:hypothetical protein
MTPLILAAAAAVLIGTALSGLDRQASRLAAALVLAGVGGGLWWSGTRAGQTPVQVEARSVAGDPITSNVLVTAAGRRDAIAVPFVRQIPVSTPLMLMLGLGLLGAAAARRDQIALLCTAGAAGAAGWAAATYDAAGGRFEGEAAARAQLQMALPDTTIQQFTVPNPWQFDTGAGLVAVAGAAVIALLWLGIGGRLKPAARPLVARLVAAGAVIAAAACLWQISLVGGLPWRTAEGALAAVALMTGAVWALRRTPLMAGAVAGLSLAAALIGMT